MTEAEKAFWRAARARDARLSAQGFRVVRFWNNEVLENTEGVMRRVGEILNNTAPRLRGGTPHPPAAARRAPPSPARGEGDKEEKMKC